MSIFVQMVAYKNFDVVATLKDCVEKCKDREGLYFGIVLQQDEDVFPELNHPRVRVQRVPFRESLGYGWARSRAQSMYEGQDYTLQIETGSRFLENWDEELIQTLNSLPSQKAVITNYANKYNPDNNEREIPNIAYKIQLHQFIQSTPFAWAAPMKGITNVLKARYVSDHYIFTRGSHITECPYDPEMYFSEVEANIALRSFTLGYDLFHHYKPVMWRDYSKRPYYWEDDSNWWVKDYASKVKFASLVNGTASSYGLGETRSLRDFELYSGIDFKNKRLQRDLFAGIDPPCKYENEDQWNKAYSKDHLVTVNWDVNEIEKCDDYDYWYFAIEDESGNTINRQDLRIERDADIINFKINYKKIFFKSFDAREPKVLCIWPVSKSKGWLKKSKFSI